MSVKELTKITVTDLWKEFKGIGDFWEMQEEAVKEFRQRFINGALEVERDMLIGCKSYERKEGRSDYRNGYWERWITLKDGRGACQENCVYPNPDLEISGNGIQGFWRQFLILYGIHYL